MAGTVYQIHCCDVGETDSGQRLDVFLAGENTELSRSHIQRLVADGLVEVNGQPARASYRVRQGDLVVLRVPPPVELVAKPEPIPLDIYYEDADVIVVNKPRGMVVHPAEGNYSGTLVNALLYHCRDLSGINGVMRPGIVHRLDKDTSGLLMAAKNDFTHLELARQLSERKVERRYLALVHGVLKHDRGVVDAPIGRHPRDRQRMAVVDRGGKAAVTHYRVIERYHNLTYLELRLETGRTHQIRVHMAWLGHPVVGDARYGPAKNRFGLEGQFLHAGLLGFVHPRSGEKMTFEAPLPGELEGVLKKALSFPV
ncbi:MAG: RluA family pseudouridine synthase [Peptococcaceae bacterium]|nr:RluA family pseudouridine synthase [Peptococcaceae bacterium]